LSDIDFCQYLERERERGRRTMYILLRKVSEVACEWRGLASSLPSLRHRRICKTIKTHLRLAPTDQLGIEVLGSCHRILVRRQNL